ncbi:MAG: hypothetical protein M5R42_03495 [Rhodocyclaceae bacterium]|nr:hypothetical protein [Rhodocyclaceae bacterium]
MPELVERGHIYIAQPPLYKIKHGKSERYIKDDHELNQHLLRLALENAELIPREGAQPIAGEALAELARSYLLSEAVISRLGSFIDSEVLHTLLANGLEIDLGDEASARATASSLSMLLSSEVRVRAHFDDKSERWQLRVEKDASWQPQERGYRRGIPSFGRLPADSQNLTTDFRPNRQQRRHAARR